MKEALFYTKTNQDTVECLLCPNQCFIRNGKAGICFARENQNGKLISLSYSKITSIGVDPIEKKPLFHFYPGSDILSIGSFGCNLKCIFCQNYTIAQTDAHDVTTTDLSPEELLDKVKISESIGAAYTYNEPLINFEYILESSKLLKGQGYKNVLVTNGFINKEPLEMIAPYIDAANIDLKSFRDSFYKNVCSGRLKDIKRSIKIMYEKGIFIELTNLVIPKLNDDINEIENMVKWIASIDENIPLHFSRYFPYYKCDIPPTNEETLISAYSHAKNYLKYVYLGNILVDKGQDTICPYCEKEVIKRKGYSTNICGLEKNKCAFCGKELNIVSKKT